jgi:hypothetical protein
MSIVLTHEFICHQVSGLTGALGNPQWQEPLIQRLLPINQQ